ncbi:hypothetical protein BH10PSE6_BH10PSE6_16780 [soil metagenome]
MSFNVISFIKSALANKGAVPVADDNPLPVGQYVGGAIVSPSNPLPVANGTDYEAVAAGQTDQIMGATGAIGDYLTGVTVQPGTTSPGTIVIKDGNTTVFTFPGGASSVSNLIPFFIPIYGNSVSGAWKVTTGANVTALGSGNFT